MLTKNLLRQQLLKKRRQLLPQFQCPSAKNIQIQLTKMPELQQSKHAALYWAFAGEVPTRSLFEELKKESRHLYLPRIGTEEKKLEFVTIKNISQLIPGPWGNLEPMPELPAIPLSQIQLMLIPGVAFDAAGHRLGFGKGYYDKTLHDFKGHRIGLAYEFQIVESVPTEPWDEKVDWVVTEERVIDCGKES